MTAQQTFDYVPDESEKTPEKSPSQSTGNRPPPPESVTITALAVIEIKKDNALSVFTAEKGLDPYLVELEARARAAIEGYDITTIAGQDGIRSVAYSLARSKKPLENMAAELKKESDALIDKVNAERNRGIKFIDDLQKELRRPLTEYEEKEKARISAHKQRLEVLAALTVFVEEPTSDAVRQRINNLADFNEVEWQEYTESAKAVRKTVEDHLADMLVKIKKAEDDASELARLRKEQAEREQKERDEKIAADAAAKAKAEAEEKARLEQEEKDRIAAAALKAEQDRLAAVEKKAADDAAAAARALKDAEELAEKQRLDREAEVKKEQDAAAERERVAKEKADKAEQDRKDAHVQAMFRMAETAKIPEQATSIVLMSKINSLAVLRERDWQEFEPEAAGIYKVGAANLKATLNKVTADEKAAEEKRRKEDDEKAAQAERDRAAAAQKVIDDATAKRAADTAHKSKINNEAKAAILKAGAILDADERAQAIVTAIAQGKIPHVTITY